jgi:hypothetical protein
VRVSARAARSAPARVAGVGGGAVGGGSEGRGDEGGDCVGGSGVGGGDVGGGGMGGLLHDWWPCAVAVWIDGLSGRAERLCSAGARNVGVGYGSAMRACNAVWWAYGSGRALRKMHLAE